MSSDADLAQKVKDYQEAAKNNPNVDIGALMLNALQTQDQNKVSSKAKKWAYLISISVPPFGLLFALKYFMFSDEADAQEVAWTCVILTAVCVALFWIGGKLLLSSSGTSMQQIQQIKPSDIYQLTQ